MGKLGYTSVALTDLTQTLPVSLTLESNLEKNIQTRTGNLFNPDFSSMKTQLGEELLEGVIITPSLFLGQEEIDLEKKGQYVNPNFNNEERNSGYLYYEIGDNRYEYGKNIDPDIYVDIKGRLHIEKNLTENITIEAYIEDFEIEAHSYIDHLVSVINPITIILLEEGSSNYQVIITSTDGREHFEDTNASPITLTASLWRGLDEVKTELSYSWNKLGDGEPDSKTEASITVYRKDITNREYFTCVITDEQTGLSYSASKFIYDFTDTYLCDIAYDKMPLLTDKNTTITLTANVWNKNTLIEPSTEGFNLSYDWFAVGSILDENKKPVEVTLRDSESENKGSSSYTLDISNIPELQYQDFVIYCKVYQTDNANNTYSIAGGTLNIHYTVQYSVKVTPQTFFIPTSYEGLYQGNDSYKYNFTFQLLDTDGNPLPRDDSQTTTVGAQNDGTVIGLEGRNGLWDFTGTIDFTNSSLWNEDVSSRIYEFTYVYLGQEFTEEINIVKSYKGEQGFSGYTIDLSNEFHAFAGGEMRADSKQSTTSRISAYYGDIGKKITQITCGNSKEIIYSNGTGNDFWYNYENINLFIQARKIQDNEVEITFRTNEENEVGKFLIEIEPVNFYVTIEEGTTFFKTFSYTINYYGKTYSLNPSSSSIVYNKDGTYNPASIAVAPTYQEANGTINSYDLGRVIYSLDEKVWKLFDKNNPIKNFENSQFVYFRLYGANANFSGGINLEDNAEYLLDVESIPILTSMEGYEIGGENLLRWSKTLPIENNKWTVNGSVIIEETQDFSIAKWTASEDSSILSSPEISYEEEYISKDFCLSFYMKGSGNTLKIYLSEIIDENIIENLIIENNSNDIYKKAYCIFKLPSSISTNFKVLFSGNEDILEIKKPKLELGNVPTAWSASVYDIDYYNVVGENIAIPEGLYQTIKTTDPYLLIADELKPNTYYTFSCQKTSWDGSDDITQFYLSLCKRTEDKFEDDELDHGESESEHIEGYKYSLENEKEELQLITFLTPSENLIYSFRIYAKNNFESDKIGNTLTVQQLKLEKGTEATPFFIDEEHLSSLIKEVQDSNEANTNEIKVLIEDGSILSSRIESNEAAISTLNELQSKYIKIDEKEGIITAASTAIYEADNGYLKRLKGKIEVSAENAAEPYIQISTTSKDNFFATRIDDKELGFYQGSSDDPVASITGNKLEINSAKFNYSFSISDLIVTITDTGVGFTW